MINNCEPKIINKLVRDNIPTIIHNNGDCCSCRVLETDDDYCKELYSKLNEEVQELTQSMSLEEMADVVEVIRAILKLHGWSEYDLECERIRKLQSNGGFENRIYLECTITNLSGGDKFEA